MVKDFLPLKVLVLFNRLSSHKKIIYTSFIKNLGVDYAVDFHLYNNDAALFRRILKEQDLDDYVRIVVVPYFEDNGASAYEVLNHIPKDKLLVLDKLDSKVNEKFTAVYEDFEQDLTQALLQLKERLSNYETIKLIFPKTSYYPAEITESFSRFCADFAFDYEIIDKVPSDITKSKVAYICLTENDLVLLVDTVLSSGHEIGKDIGIVSYNETPVKKMIVQGITTVSADFNLMGAKAAEFVKNRITAERFAVPFQITIRKSL